jgi:cobaltochelatase CobT
MNWGAGLTIALTVAFFGWLIWASFRGPSRRRPKPADDRPDQIYSAYTSNFDVIARGREVPLLTASQIYANHAPTGTRVPRLDRRISAATGAYENARTETREALMDAISSLTDRMAITLLIDQSGSMCNKIVPVAGQIRFLGEELQTAGIPVEILGFTTTSWKGGRSRQAWIESGKPQYPGRLSDLLHVIYKEFEIEMNQEDWEGMLDARALRENIDGEAIHWAAQRLMLRPEADKRLIVISDGAPVDDSTIMENGTQFLPRHLKEVVTEIERNNMLRLALIDLDDYESSCFNTRITLENEGELVGGFVQAMEAMNKAAKSPQ